MGAEDAIYFERLACLDVVRLYSSHGDSYCACGSRGLVFCFETPGPQKGGRVRNLPGAPWTETLPLDSAITCAAGGPSGGEPFGKCAGANRARSRPWIDRCDPLADHSDHPHHHHPPLLTIPHHVACQPLHPP